MKKILYCSCFIVSMTGGVAISSYMDKSGIFNKQDTFAKGAEGLGRETRKSQSGDSADTGSKEAQEDDIKDKKPEERSVIDIHNDSADSNSVARSAENAETTQINEQFDGNSLDTDLWAVIERPAGYRNNEEQAYAMSQVAVRDGHLVITAQRDQGGQWVSGEVNSKWSYRYGDFEVRARISAHGAGVWPAAWLFNSAGVWPGGGEIDIYESINNEMSVYGTIHAGGSNGHWQRQSGLHNIDPRIYHVYKISKQPNSISWWVDGVKKAEWNKESLSSGQSWPFEDFSYIALLNLAIGGSWPGPSGDDTPVKIEYYIDYFTVKNARQ